MAGVAQSTYLMPQDQVAGFVRDLQRADMLSDTAQLQKEECLFVLRSAVDGLHPSLAFWDSRNSSGSRTIDLHWIVGQDEIAAQVDAIARKHGGMQQP